MPRYGKQKKAYTFDDLVDAVGGNLEYLARSDVRARAKAQGFEYPDDFAEALAEYREEHGISRPKAASAPVKKTATARKPRARKPKVSQPAIAVVKPASTTRAPRTRTPRTASASTPTSTAAKPRKSSAGAGAQTRRLNKANAYAYVAAQARDLAKRIPDSEAGEVLVRLANEYAKAGERLYATFTKNA
jgi:hypothetical protein